MVLLSRRKFVTTGGIAFGSITRGSAQTPLSTGRVLTLACADYLRYTPIATRDVRPSDFTLNWIQGDRTQMLRRATSDPAVDGGETSMAQHVMRLARGDRALVAVPVFPLRNFTARDIYTRKGSTLTPKALGGRRIGIYNWAASGAVWYRHLVRYWGHDPKNITWIVGSPDQTTPVNPGIELPPNITLARAGASLSDLLLAGEVEAFFAPLPPSKHHPVDGPIVRLVPEFRAIEQQYFARTRCYPPQHVLVLHRRVWEADPSIGKRLVELFDRCETMFQAKQRQFPYSTPWLMAEIEDSERALGRDFHAHGLERNRHALDVFCQSAYEDGLTKRRVTVDEFFEEFLSRR